MPDFFPNAIKNILNKILPEQLIAYLLKNQKKPGDFSNFHFPKQGSKRISE
jgi:hypothetical protein